MLQLREIAKLGNQKSGHLVNRKLEQVKVLQCGISSTSLENGKKTQEQGQPQVIPDYTITPQVFWKQELSDEAPQ